MKKDTLQSLGILMLIAALAVALLIFFRNISSSESSKESRLMYQSTSPDGRHEIKIFAYGTPLFFGPQEIGIQLAPSGYDTIVTYVGNDGATIRENNFDISWNDNVATVTVMGKEQYPAIYEITFYPKWNNYSFKKVQSKETRMK